MGREVGIPSDEMEEPELPLGAGSAAAHEARTPFRGTTPCGRLERVDSRTVHGADRSAGDTLG